MISLTIKTKPRPVRLLSLWFMTGMMSRVARSEWSLNSDVIIIILSLPQASMIIGLAVSKK